MDNVSENLLGVNKRSEDSKIGRDDFLLFLFHQEMSALKFVFSPLDF